MYFPMNGFILTETRCTNEQQKQSMDNLIGRPTNIRLNTSIVNAYL